MSDDLLFNMERLRKNWQPQQEDTSPRLPEVLAHVTAAPTLPLQEARELLSRLEALVLLRFPSQRDALQSFFLEARTQMAEPQQTLSAPAFAAVQAALNGLEELLEVFALVMELDSSKSAAQEADSTRKAATAAASSSGISTSTGTRW
jgi:hypothetical protein